MHRFLLVCAFVGSGLLLLPSCAATTIRNHASLPALRQQVIDLAAVYRGRPTDIVIPQTSPAQRFKYEALDGSADVAMGDVLTAAGQSACWSAFGFEFKPGSNPPVQQLGDHKALPGQPRAFKGLPGGAGNQKDWDSIVQGKYHCSPTVATMILIYWAKEHGKPDLMQGITDDAAGHLEMIKRLAELVDTNDQNATNRANDDLGHIGTFGNDQAAGIREYARANGGYNLKVEAIPVKMDDYRREINAHRPVIIFFGNPGKKVGHVVVGYGYDGNKVLFKDPWDGSEGTKDAGDMGGISSIQAGMEKAYGAVPLPIEPAFAGDAWIDVFMMTVGEDVTP